MKSKISRVIAIYLNRISVYFYYTAKPDFLNPIFYLRRLRERNSIKELKKIDNGKLLSYIDLLISESKSTGCEYSDYYSLWQVLNEKKPNLILECGAGISTVVFGYYSLKESNSENQIKIISLEEHKMYYDNINKIFPKDLKQNVKFLLRDRKEKLYNGHLGSYYDDIPDLNYDFIYVDGPVDRKVFNDKKYPKTFNADLINVLLKGDCTINAALDQRIHTYRIYRKLLTKKKVKYNVVKKLTFLNDLTIDSVNSILK